jgi:hypothetical protein
VKVSEGDLRKAITFLQSAARLNTDNEITESAVIEIAGVSASNVLHSTSVIVTGFMRCVQSCQWRGIKRLLTILTFIFLRLFPPR